MKDSCVRKWNRRDALRMALAGSAAAATLGCASSRGVRSAGVKSSGEFADAVDAGRRYFAKRCDDQLPLVEDLVRAIRSRDLVAAQRAYVESRPPYEEIETLAASFEDSDADIDARPYAFEGGETDPEFRGFHKVEAFLFGYEDLDAAEPFALDLVASVRKLRSELAERSRFSASGQFGGMIALTNEVAAKKISSEEETWSDQTLLIFRHNWIGAFSQVAPFLPLLARRDESAAEEVRDAHGAAMALLDGHFSPGSAAGTPYSHIGMRERRAMADASNRFRDGLIRASGVLGIEPG